MKKNEQVYDNVKYKTPMRRMLEEQAAKEEALKAKMKPKSIRPKKSDTEEE